MSNLQTGEVKDFLLYLLYYIELSDSSIVKFAQKMMNADTLDGYLISQFLKEQPKTIIKKIIKEVYDTYDSLTAWQKHIILQFVSNLDDIIQANTENTWSIYLVKSVIHTNFQSFKKSSDIQSLKSNLPQIQLTLDDKGVMIDLGISFLYSLLIDNQYVSGLLTNLQNISSTTNLNLYLQKLKSMKVDFFNELGFRLESEGINNLLIGIIDNIKNINLSGLLDNLYTISENKDLISKISKIFDDICHRKVDNSRIKLVLKILVKVFIKLGDGNKEVEAQKFLQNYEYKNEKIDKLLSDIGIMKQDGSKYVIQEQYDKILALIEKVLQFKFGDIIEQILKIKLSDTLKSDLNSNSNDKNTLKKIIKCFIPENTFDEQTFQIIMNYVFYNKDDFKLEKYKINLIEGIINIITLSSTDVISIINQKLIKKPDSDKAIDEILNILKIPYRPFTKEALKGIKAKKDLVNKIIGFNKIEDNKLDEYIKNHGDKLSYDEIKNLVAQIYDINDISQDITNKIASYQKGYEDIINLLYTEQVNYEKVTNLFSTIGIDINLLNKSFLEFSTLVLHGKVNDFSINNIYKFFGTNDSFKSSIENLNIQPLIINFPTILQYVAAMNNILNISELAYIQEISNHLTEPLKRFDSIAQDIKLDISKLSQLSKDFILYYLNNQMNFSEMIKKFIGQYNINDLLYIDLFGILDVILKNEDIIINFVDAKYESLVGLSFSLLKDNSFMTNLGLNTVVQRQDESKLILQYFYNKFSNKYQLYTIKHIFVPGYNSMTKDNIVYAIYKLFENKFKLPVTEKNQFNKFLENAKINIKDILNTLDKIINAYLAGEKLDLYCIIKCNTIDIFGIVEYVLSNKDSVFQYIEENGLQQKLENINVLKSKSDSNNKDNIMYNIIAAIDDTYNASIKSAKNSTEDIYISVLLECAGLFLQNEHFKTNIHDVFSLVMNSNNLKSILQLQIFGKYIIPQNYNKLVALVDNELAILQTTSQAKWGKAPLVADKNYTYDNFDKAINNFKNKVGYFMQTNIKLLLGNILILYKLELMNDSGYDSTNYEKLSKLIGEAFKYHMGDTLGAYTKKYLIGDFEMGFDMLKYYGLIENYEDFLKEKNVTSDAMHTIDLLIAYFLKIDNTSNAVFLSSLNEQDIKILNNVYQIDESDNLIQLLQIISMISGIVLTFCILIKSQEDTSYDSMNKIYAKEYSDYVYDKFYEIDIKTA